MANVWFRMYSEFATDPKVQMMSEADQRRFIMVLCMRCSNVDVTLQDEQVAFQLRISNEEWARTKALFLSKNLIDEDNKPLAWDKRQYRSDSSAERVARHREKKKQECNVTVTPHIQKQIQKTDTEVNPTSLRDVPLSDSAKSKSVTLSQWIVGVHERGERLMSDYEPLTAYAEKVGLPADWVELAWLQFRDRYTTDEKCKRKRYADWRRVFKRAVEENWMKIWFYSDADKQFRLTTVGVAADLATREAA